MKAVVVRRGSETPAVTDVPRPEPDDGEVLVRTLRVGIDGTDHEVVDGGHGGFPDGEDHMVLGHEAVGVVEAPNDTGFAAGDVVVPTVRRPPAGTANEFFDRNEPDMAPAGAYVERGIVGAHGFMAEYFTSPADFLVSVPSALAAHAFLVEPLSNAAKAMELADASRSSFTWNPEAAIVLGNGPLGLLTLALLVADDQFERTYCLGRRDRPDPTIDVIEALGATYVDSRETPVDELPGTHEAVDLVVEATGHARHVFEAIDALSANGVAALLSIPGDWSFEVDGGRLHRAFVLENRALVGSVNSHVRHFEAARASLREFPAWLLEDLVTGVYPPGDAARAFDDNGTTIKQVVEFEAP